jgi:hypothetical protein
MERVCAGDSIAPSYPFFHSMGWILLPPFAHRAASIWWLVAAHCQHHLAPLKPLIFRDEDLNLGAEGGVCSL